ncbi:MAG TPA: DUF917 family protein [Epulopiscium sp.]|nr:DUF917 family protein [Candidatus Epulonipiscium sp.]
MRKNMDEKTLKKYAVKNIITHSEILGHAIRNLKNSTTCIGSEIVATVPDLICLVDPETFTPVNTDALKYGKRVFVVGLKCFKMWRPPKGLELIGPRYFDCNTDYIPVEERA